MDANGAIAAAFDPVNQALRVSSATSVPLSTVTTADQLIVSTGAGAVTPLTVAASTFVGKKATGGVVALTVAESRSLLGLGTAALVDTGTSAANVPTIALADARYMDLTSAQTIQGAKTFQSNSGGSNPIRVLVDTGDGNGLRQRFTVENNPSTLTDINFRSASVNIGDHDAAASLAGTAMLFFAPVGDTSNPIVVYKAGDQTGGVASFYVGRNGNVQIHCGGLASTALEVGVHGAANMKLTVSESGVLSWGAGGASAVDTSLSRLAANVLGMGTSGTFKAQTLQGLADNWTIKDSGGSTAFTFRASAGDVQAARRIILQNGAQFSDATDMIVGSTTGTKIGTATTQKLGFWNKTPIVQPTTGITAAGFVANTSGIANDTATFGGYTVGQIAAALINVGVLA